MKLTCHGAEVNLLRQENCHEFEASLGYKENFRPMWLYCKTLFERNINNDNKYANIKTEIEPISFSYWIKCSNASVLNRPRDEEGNSMNGLLILILVTQLPPKSHHGNLSFKMADTFTMASEPALVWYLLIKLRSKSVLDSYTEIPMSYFIRLVRWGSEKPSESSRVTKETRDRENCSGLSEVTWCISCQAVQRLCNHLGGSL